MLGIKIMSVAAAVVLVAYVIGGIADTDLGSSAALVRIVVVVAAVVVAIVTFQAFSHHSSAHTISAMIVGLLGGASLASAVTTATGHDLYGSGPMALVGTVAVVAAATIAQIGQTRNGQTRNKEDAR